MTARLTRAEEATLKRHGFTLLKNNHRQVVIEGPGLNGPIKYRQSVAWAQGLVKELRAAARRGK